MPDAAYLKRTEDRLDQMIAMNKSLLLMLPAAKDCAQVIDAAMAKRFSRGKPTEYAALFQTAWDSATKLLSLIEAHERVMDNDRRIRQADA